MYRQMRHTEFFARDCNGNLILAMFRCRTFTVWQLVSHSSVIEAICRLYPLCIYSTMTVFCQMKDFGDMQIELLTTVIFAVSLLSNSPTPEARGHHQQARSVAYSVVVMCKYTGVDFAFCICVHANDGVSPA